MLEHRERVKIYRPGGLIIPTNTAKWDEKKSLWRIVVTRDGKK